MATRRKPVKFDQKAIRHWTLYVVKLEGGQYYIGITSYKDFMRRIRQHGGRAGARVNRGKNVSRIIEVHPLGVMNGLTASRIENDMMLEYRKRYGASKVRGGYDISKNAAIVPTYTPGTLKSYIFVAVCVVIGILLLLFIAKSQP